jgi:hypothetical protein
LRTVGEALNVSCAVHALTRRVCWRAGRPLQRRPEGYGQRLGQAGQGAPETGAMGFDLDIKGDIVFSIFTDGISPIDGIVSALP